MDAAKKQQALKPKLDSLKEKYSGDKTKLFEEQSKLMKEEGINPAAGCLPAIIQLGIIIILIRAFSGILSSEVDVISKLNSVAYVPALEIQAGEQFNTKFLTFDLTERDVLLNVGALMFQEYW